MMSDLGLGSEIRVSVGEIGNGKDGPKGRELAPKSEKRVGTWQFYWGIKRENYVFFRESSWI